MNNTAIQIEGLSKKYQIGAKQEQYKTLRDTMAAAATMPFRAVRSTFQRAEKQQRKASNTLWALKDVTLDIGHGEVVGIIGRNGAGKSTLLKVLSRITEPTEGRAEIHGRVGSLLEVGTGFHQELTGRENIYLNGAILGMPRAQINSKFDEIVAFAEVEKFIDTAVKHYSSGMYLRLAFAVAAHLEPDILLVDEVLAVGDAAFQAKCLGKMGEVAKQGRTVLFVSHNMAAIRSLCDRGIVLNEGTVALSGPVAKAIEAYYRMITTTEVESRQDGEKAGSGPLRDGFSPITLPVLGQNTISQSEAFTVSSTLHVANDVEGLTLWCTLDDMNGRHVFSLREESSLLGLGRIAKGDYKIEVNVPALWLLPGLYSLYFKVRYWGDTASSRFLSDTFPLDVAGKNSRVEAVLSPEAGWSVEQVKGKAS
jgi:lipopolysaccharide transport system ATP-binding protein